MSAIASLRSEDRSREERRHCRPSSWLLDSAIPLHGRLRHESGEECTQPGDGPRLQGRSSSVARRREGSRETLQRSTAAGVGGNSQIGGTCRAGPFRIASQRSLAGIGLRGCTPSGKAGRSRVSRGTAARNRGRTSKRPGASPLGSRQSGSLTLQPRNGGARLASPDRRLIAMAFNRSGAVTRRRPAQEGPATPRRRFPLRARVPRQARWRSGSFVCASASHCPCGPAPASEHAVMRETRGFACFGRGIPAWLPGQAGKLTAYSILRRRSARARGRLGRAGRRIQNSRIRTLRNSTFIGGPTCTCKPILPLLSPK